VLRSLQKSLLLLFFAVVICCGLYPLALWTVGQTLFPFQSNGSMLNGPNGKPVGSLLIAQPFTKDEYFQPRPSAASYDASASSSSALAASNYALRNRIANSIGPIVKFRSGAKAGQLVASDIENWYQQDTFLDQPHIVAQWAILHNSLAQAWVSADPSHGAYVDNWAKTHLPQVNKFIKANPSNPNPKTADLAVVFFQNFSVENPGKFLSAIPHIAANGETTTTIEAVNTGTDIQSVFFDMWRQEHPKVELQDVPADMVTTSGSGLDPHITLQNALFQLDRIAPKIANNLKRDPNDVRNELIQILNQKSSAPFGGLAGEKIINVLEINLELHKRYGSA
jgi:potassium-transporting ATPase KdpC subunit